MEDLHGGARARFGDGTEGRQVFAIDTRDPQGDLVYLGEGEAATWRSDARSGHLICPIPDCPSPSFITVGGSRRHHFRHLKKGVGSHAPESLAHHTAKHLIGYWARRQYPSAEVRVDDERIDNGQLPDVLVKLEDGTRYALEVQYSALTADDWQRRHDGYTSQGIHDVWILGHRPPNLRRSRRAEDKGEPQLGPLHAAIHRNGLPLLWIDPFNELIGAGLLGLYDSERLSAPDGKRFWGRVDLAIAPLAAMRFEGSSVTVPVLGDHLRKVDGERRARDKEERQRKAKEKQRQAAEEERAKQRRASIARSLEYQERKRLKRVARQREWEPARDRLLASLGGKVPPFITDPDQGDNEIWFRSPDYWRASLFAKFIVGRVGESLRFDDLVAELRAEEQDHTGRTNSLVAHFLRRLQSSGYVDFDDSGLFAQKIGGEIRVLADPFNPPAKPDDSVEQEWQPSADRPEAHPPSDLTTPAGPSLSSYDPEIDQSDLLRSLAGLPGRRRWQIEGLIYVRRPKLRRVPDVITDIGPGCRDVGVYPPLWHHLIIQDCIDGHIGDQISIQSAAAALGYTSHPPSRIEAAIHWYLDHLSEWGLLRPGSEDSYVVASDLHAGHPNPPANESTTEVEPG